MWTHRYLRSCARGSQGDHPMKFDCPICHIQDAIVAHLSLSGGTYWEPPEDDLETSQNCSCDLSDAQWETIERVTAENADDNYEDPREEDDLAFDDDQQEPAA